MISINTLAITKAEFFILASRWLNWHIFLANAFPLPPGNTPIGISLAFCQSILLYIPLIASWGRPSPDTNIIPLYYNRSFYIFVYIITSRGIFYT